MQREQLQHTTKSGERIVDYGRGIARNVHHLANCNRRAKKKFLAVRWSLLAIRWGGASTWTSCREKKVIIQPRKICNRQKCASLSILGYNGRLINVWLSTKFSVSVYCLINTLFIFCLFGNQTACGFTTSAWSTKECNGSWFSLNLFLCVKVFFVMQIFRFKSFPISLYIKFVTERILP